MKTPELQRVRDEPLNGAATGAAPDPATAEHQSLTSVASQELVEADDSTRMAYSRLAMRLERDLLHEEHGASVLIMAADYDRVAIEASTELAWHFAEDLGRRVLLVDGSFGRNGLTKALGGDRAPGLQDILTSGAPMDAALRAAMRRTAHPAISFVACGSQQSAQRPAARAAALGQFLSVAAALCDFVLVQGPAVSRASRTLAFGPLVDATLLIALEGELSLSEIANAQTILNECGAERVGLVLGAPRARPGESA
ncbi:MAG: hypothetical protein IPM80_13370 [Proteobacteria bacterium]|nr:hypothetical protein [Pseudomonadota bacterium]